MTFDLIAVGESLRDVFYMIDEATVSCTIDTARCQLCLEYGKKIPVRDVVKVPAAGNSANAAVGASRLGLNAALVTWVGHDPAGADIQRALRTDGVDNRYVAVDKKIPTSEATILNFKSERTQLVYFQPRAYALPRLEKTSCIYYSALGIKHALCDKAMLRELARHKDVFFVFQPGTTHIAHGMSPTLKKLIARANLFILNKEEAHDVLRDGKRTVKNMLEAFHRIGARNVVITDGKNGADGFDGRSALHMPIFPGKPKETTGAGDSFAIGVTAALLGGKGFAEALRWGTANSWSVVREVGPQKGLLDTRGMARTLKKFSSIHPHNV